MAAMIVLPADPIFRLTRGLNADGRQAALADLGRRQRHRSFAPLGADSAFRFETIPGARAPGNILSPLTRLRSALRR